MIPYLYVQEMPFNVESLIAMAERLSKEEGKEYLAIRYINEAIKQQPKRTELYYKRAFILGRARQYVYAIQDFNIFVKHKNYPHAIRFRADCYMALGNYPQAARDYMTFLRKQPEDGKVWSYLAEAFALMGDRNSALDATGKGLATKSHWSPRLLELQKSILLNEKIKPHKPFSN